MNEFLYDKQIANIIEVQKDVLQQGKSSESIITDICNSVDPLPDHIDSSDTSLKLGLVDYIQFTIKLGQKFRLSEHICLCVWFSQTYTTKKQKQKNL